MKIKTLKKIIINSKPIDAGREVDVDRDIAMSLISRGYAEVPKAGKQEKTGIQSKPMQREKGEKADEKK